MTVKSFIALGPVDVVADVVVVVAVVVVVGVDGQKDPLAIVLSGYVILTRGVHVIKLF
jgi:hypothetical protein